LHQRPTTGNVDIAAKTGNNYIPGTDSVEIPTANSGFKYFFNYLFNTLPFPANGR